ncbi:hypothetical protein [Algoriphagus persicinus]|uniref:hypothetical protein n=1 Tax=Algoriphagus persicinus TaxID=3108754 RepID=UPI002B3839DD|nr:hypothetical protein [Algoriphagus sp. E1-3-M2]MEB2784744.1 hypothetical protein [Algoriphagus sp. E1-3-M2]
MILAFIVVSTGPNSGLFFLTFWIGKQVLGLAPASKKVFLTGLGVGIATLGLIVLAPGNFARSAGKLDFSLFNASKGFLSVFWEYVKMSKWAVFGSLLLAFVIPKGLVINNTKLILLVIFCSLSTILPFVVMPQAASKHTSNFFQTGLFLALIFIFINGKPLIPFYRSTIPKQLALFSFSVFLYIKFPFN